MNQSVCPVGTGPESVPSPNTAFWRTSWRSTAIEIAWRTRLSLNGLRVEFITWMTSQALGLRITVTRSEEHTSELQSLAYLVCRLLLEKKKRNHNRTLH